MFWWALSTYYKTIQCAPSETCWKGLLMHMLRAYLLYLWFLFYLCHSWQSSNPLFKSSSDRDCMSAAGYPFWHLIPPPRAGLELWSHGHPRAPALLTTAARSAPAAEQGSWSDPAMLCRECATHPPAPLPHILLARNTVKKFVAGKNE